MANRLLAGIPRTDDYSSLLGSDDFSRLERFSEQFLRKHANVLADYARKWVTDPLHQWSRQWEYPFVFSRIAPILDANEAAKVLDAGSGVTFFPYYVKSRYASADIHCNDYDASLAEIYSRISASEGEVKFACSDLRELSYKDDTFDVIYCISVLEHTDRYAEIIERLNRILVGGGRLIVTFDISLDGRRDISVEKATKLLEALAERFDVDEDVSFDLQSHVSRSGNFTTLAARDIDANLLPWKAPAFIYQMRSLCAGKGLCSWPPPLTVFCASLTKRSV